MVAFVAACGGTGFATQQTWWLFAGLALAAVVAALTSVAFAGRAHRLTGLPGGQPLRRLTHPAEVLTLTLRARQVVPAAALLTVAVIASGVLTGQMLAAHTLENPRTSSAFEVSTSIDCGRCWFSAHATFRAGARVVSTDLAAPTHGDGSYRPGMPVIYDARKPNRAMAFVDFRTGRSSTEALLLAASLLVAAASIAAAAAGWARTQRRFGDARPNVPITALQYRDRRSQRWHITYADGVTLVTYDNPLARAVLQARTAPDTVIDSAARDAFGYTLA